MGYYELEEPSYSATSPDYSGSGSSVSGSSGPARRLEGDLYDLGSLGDEPGSGEQGGDDNFRPSSSNSMTSMGSSSSRHNNDLRCLQGKGMKAV